MTFADDAFPGLCFCWPCARFPIPTGVASLLSCGMEAHDGTGVRIRCADSLTSFLRRGGRPARVDCRRFRPETRDPGPSSLQTMMALRFWLMCVGLLSALSSLDKVQPLPFWRSRERRRQHVAKDCRRDPPPLFPVPALAHVSAASRGCQSQLWSMWMGRNAPRK